MLVGAYPFEDPNEPKDFRKTINVFNHSDYHFVYFTFPVGEGG